MLFASFALPFLVITLLMLKVLWNFTLSTRFLSLSARYCKPLKTSLQNFEHISKTVENIKIIYSFVSLVKGICDLSHLVIRRLSIVHLI